jgi:hypothetical protein
MRENHHYEVSYFIDRRGGTGSTAKNYVESTVSCVLVDNRLEFINLFPLSD